MESKGIIVTESVYHLGLKEGHKTPTKLGLLARGDSGYISPITPASNGATPSDGTVVRRSLSTARVRSTSSEDKESGDSSPDGESPLDQYNPGPISFGASENIPSMQRSVREQQRSFLGEGTVYQSEQPVFEHLQQRPLNVPTQHIPPVSSDLQLDNQFSNDILLLAFNCRGSRSDWNKCTHPYCFIVRKKWYQFRLCCNGLPHACSECSKFLGMVRDHANMCNDQTCPVVMCSETKRLRLSLQLREDKTTSHQRKGGLIRSQSFTEHTPTSELQSLPSFPTSYGHTSYDPDDFSVRGYLAQVGLSNAPGSLSMDMIQAKAEAIVERLDKEEPLLQSNDLPSGPSSLPSERPKSLNASIIKPDSLLYHGVPGVGGNALSPIVEGREDMSPSETHPSFDHASLIQRSYGQYQSFGGQSSFDADGVLGGMPSMGGVSHVSDHQEMSTNEEQEDKRVYPTQHFLHKLVNEYLIPGEDSFYYQHRDYYLNDVNKLGEGGFGTCVVGKDNTTEKLFAMKRNNKSDESIIDSIRSECFVLSRLSHHNHVIQFLGAVIDQEDNNVYLPRVCKMFMELADSGNLAGLLVIDDVGTLAPLPLEQSLYYIEQLLQGVHFLHSNGVIHLDIKAVNILVFDGGRTVKLADFGTAVELSEIAAVGMKMVGCTPYFAAPEVVLQEQPGFSADIWSVMCVLVEILTTNWPGCHPQTPGCRAQTINHHQMMYLIGKYSDDDIDKLIPLKTLNLDPEIEQLFRSVFVADRTKRPSALTLLHHPRIAQAPEYESEFDVVYDDEIEEMSQESPELLQQAPPINTQTTSTQVCEQAPPPLCYERSNSDLESDHVRASFEQRKSESQDSGTGDELERNLIARGGPARSSTSTSSGRPEYNKYDSGFETPNSADRWRETFNHWRAGSVDNIEEHDNLNAAFLPAYHPLQSDNFHSFPQMSQTPDQFQFQRSSSLTYRSKASETNTQTPIPHSRNNHPEGQRLYHCHSAPIVGDNYSRRRRSSLQTLKSYSSESSEFGEGRPKLRRTSSMVYVDRGPEIDMPDSEKVPSIQDLILDVSGLNLDHTHSPSHSTSTRSDAQLSNQASVSCSSASVAPLAHAYELPSSKPNIHIAMPTETRLTSYSTSQIAHKAPPTATPTERVYKSVTVYETIC